MQNDRFDRFSQRARQVLALAQEEAQRFNHNYIGTEHLLLGLVREGEGVAAKVLTNLGVDLQKVRRAVETIIGRGNRAPHGEIGLTPRARKVIELGADEARRLGHRYIGTEHLLLGLVREGEGIAAGVLERLGVDLEKVRQQTVLVLSQSIPTAGRSGWRSSGPGRPPGPPGAEQPLPHLGHLRRVVPVAQTTHHGEVDLTVLSLEDYDAGFRVLVRVMATGPDRPTAGSAYFPFAQTDLTADDDRGGSYVPVRRDRRGGDQEWRFELDFTPSLDPAARQLRLEVPPDPASGAAPASAQPDISQAQPWTLFIPLPA